MSHIPQLILFYVAGVWARRWSVVLVAWMVCLAGWSSVALMPDRFTSFARVYVDTESLIAPLMRGLAVQLNVDHQVDVVRRTLLSRPNMEQLVRMTDLDLSVTSEIDMDKLVARLAREIQVKTEQRNLFRISYDDNNPDVAQRVVDSVLRIFVEENLGSSQRDVDSARRFIDQQIAEYERKLRESESRVAHFKQEHTDKLAGPERALQALRRAEGELRRLETEREATIWQRDQLRVELTKTPEKIPAGELRVAGLSAEEEELMRLREELSRLKLIYTERHPDIVSMKALVEKMEADMAGRGDPDSQASRRQMIDNPVYVRIAEKLKEVELTVAKLERQIEIIETDLEGLQTNVARSPEVEAELAQLTRDYDVLSKHYNELIQRREAARLAESLGSETKSVEFRIVEPPLIPTRPSGPKHMLFMTAVLVLGICAGVGVAVLRIQLSDNFVNVEQLEKSFGLPVLGSISVARSAAAHVRAIEWTGLASAAAALVICFSMILYFYQFAVERPDVAGAARELKQTISRQVQSWI